MPINPCLRFYRDTLGLRIAGASENYGIEQERLNNVFGARLRITALKTLHGPGVELLEYLSPRNGRPMPVDTSANDLWHWQIQVTTSDIDQIGTALRDGHYKLISSGAVKIPEDKHDSTQSLLAQGLIARDPDGHALMFIQH